MARLPRRESRLVAGHLGPKRFNLRASDAALGTDIFRFGKTSPGIFKGSLTLPYLGNCAFERELRQFRIQLEQCVTGLDAMPLIDHQLGNEPSDRCA
jgi:hypothetical protein